MNPNKEAVAQYFKTDRSYAGGKALYSKCSNAKSSMVRMLNMVSETPSNLSKLHYELAMVAGFSERQLTIMLQQPLQKASEVVTLSAVEGSQATDNNQQTPTNNLIPNFPKGLPGVKAMKAFCTEKGIEVTGTGKKGAITKADLEKAINEWAEAQTSSDVTSSAVEKSETTDNQQSSTNSIRKQFPFLSQDECPAIYKELVGDLVSAYEKYVAAHPELHKDLTADEVDEKVRAVVEAYAENKLIIDELAYYQKNGAYLGKHPKFEMVLFKDSLELKSADELATLKGNITSTISKQKKAFKEAEGTNPEAEEKAKNRLEKEKQMLGFVVAELASR